MRAPPLLILARLGSWGVADQAIQSVANFVTLVLFARATSQADFGAFSLALTGITFEMTLASAALNQPFAILGASESGDRYRGCVTSVLLAHGVFGAVVTMLVLIAACVATLLGWEHVGLLVAAIPAMLAIQVQDFLRQVLYVENRLQAAFVNDAVNYGGLCAGIAGLAAAGALTSVAGLMVMAAASAGAVVIGIVQLRRSIQWSWGRVDVIAHNRAIWRIGRWTLGVASLSVSSSYLTPFVLGIASGAASAGALRAMITVMGPINIVYRTITTALVPAAARAFDALGLAGLVAMTRRAAGLVFLPVATYSLIAAVGARPILSFLYGEDYSSVAWLMPLVALSFFLGAMSSVMDAVLRAQRITDTPFRVSVTNFVFFWIVGVPLIYGFGLRGAVTTLVVVPIIALVILLQRWSRVVRNRRADRVMAQA